MTAWTPGTTIYNCPLPACEWRYTLPEGDEWRGIEAPEPEALSPEALSNATPGEFAAAIGRQRMLAVERVLEGHLKTHTLVEWVTEINRLTGLLGQVAHLTRPEVAELLRQSEHETYAYGQPGIRL